MIKHEFIYRRDEVDASYGIPDNGYWTMTVIMISTYEDETGGESPDAWCWVNHG